MAGVMAAIKPSNNDREWRKESHPWPLWHCVIEHDLLSERKKRLLAVAACRRVADALADHRSSRMLEACDAYAEGLIDIEAFLRYDADASAVAREYEQTATAGDVRLAANAAKWLGVDDYKVGRALEFSSEVFGFRALVAAGVTESAMTGFDAVQHWQHPVFVAGQYEEESIQADLLRDVIANPFRQISIEPEWRTSTVMALTQRIYAEQDYEILPILADAIEDAGCGNRDVLDHCRDPRLVHVKGCWLVDLILGKA
jgi:hypothetical protein